MDLNKFKKDSPELYNQIVEQATADAESKFQEKATADAAAAAAALAEKDAVIAGLQSDNSKLSESVTDLTARTLKLEKQDALRTEAQLDAQAKSIIDTKLSTSAVPERLFSKVRAQLSREKFMKDGSLDVMAFTAAVDAEITDWEEAMPATQFAVPASTRTVVPGKEDQFSVDATVERMLAGAGGQTKTQ